jgi:4-diphosphocytidyl-2-C-methyl-D-erythritol kinase
MITFPNCKINLGLRVLRKRNDGYHDLETVFYPIPFYDILELIPSANTGLSFSVTGIEPESNKSDNLCVKAFELLKKDFPSISGAQIQLHKAIPSGAGLGGGSADAAFTLRTLNDQYGLGLSQHELIRYALQLGSDCPFFIINQPCFATGRGEELIPVKVDLSAYTIILVNPGIHVSTANAFRGISPAEPETSIEKIIQQPVESWKDQLVNDFEQTVFPLYPAIRSVKEELYKAGAIYVSMSGSGSTVYGIYPKDKYLSLSFPDTYLVKELKRQLQ